MGEKREEIQSERGTCREPARVSGRRKAGNREERRRQQRRIGGRQEALWDSFQRTQAILYYGVSHPLSCRTLPPAPPSPEPSRWNPTSLYLDSHSSPPFSLSLSPPFQPPPLACTVPFRSLPARHSSLYPMSESKGVLWGWIEGAVRGHVGEEVEGHGRERNVSAKRCMYRRRYVHAVRYMYMCTCRALCAYVCVPVCVRICVWRGERRRWAILISLRGLSSTSNFPHRSRLYGTSPANQPPYDHHPPPVMRPRERTESELWLSAVISNHPPPVSILPLLVLRSFHICPSLVRPGRTLCPLQSLSCA